MRQLNQFLSISLVACGVFFIVMPFLWARTGQFDATVTFEGRVLCVKVQNNTDKSATLEVTGTSCRCLQFSPKELDLPAGSSGVFKVELSSDVSSATRAAMIIEDQRSPQHSELQLEFSYISSKAGFQIVDAPIVTCFPSNE